jgi:hypothetical protein
VKIRVQTVGELVVVGLATLAAVAPIGPETVERWFSTTLYSYLQRAITPASNLVPFAVLDVAAIMALVIVSGGLVRATRRSIRDRRIGPIARAGLHLVAAAAGAYLVFLLLWGLNYRRVPMTARLLVEQGAPTAAAVVGLGLRAAAELNALHGGAHAAGWAQPEWRNDRHRRAFVDVVRSLSDAPPPVPGRLKRTLLGRYFRWASVDGMINPFGLETLVNPDLLPFERPFVAAHEWAHLAGFGDEAEANFIGWLACVRGDVAAQYSGWLALYWQVSEEVDQEARTRLGKAIEAGPRRDVDAIIGRLRRGQVPWLKTAGWALYDKYLKANRVDAGVRSYGAVVTLILRARFQDGWVPVRRSSGS